MLKAAIGNNAISEDMMSKVGGNIIYGGDGLELFWERQKGYSFSQRQKATLVILQAHPTLLSKERNQPSFLLLISSLQCHLQT